MGTVTASNDLIPGDGFIPVLGYVRHCLPQSWDDGAAGIYNSQGWIADGRCIWVGYTPSIAEAHALFRPFWTVLGRAERPVSWFWLVPPVPANQVEPPPGDWPSVLFGALLLGESIAIYATSNEALDRAVWQITKWFAPAAGNA